MFAHIHFCLVRVSFNSAPCRFLFGVASILLSAKDARARSAVLRAQAGPPHQLKVGSPASLTECAGMTTVVPN